MTLMLLCSGQGTQHLAMFDRLRDEPAAQHVLTAASDRLGIDVRNLETEGAALNLPENRVAQILVTTHCLAVRAVLGEEIGDICVGYSVGEIAAAACAGAFDAETAFELIEQRALCMDAAREEAGADQGMLAVIGIPVEAIEKLANESGAAIAIVNGADHVVIGGAVSALDAIEPRLPGAGARNIRRLPVQIASHTRFIESAGSAFADVLAQIPWRTPRLPLLSGIDGRMIRSHADAIRALSEQLWKPLHFNLSLEMARERGATSAFEIGPGHSLTKLTSELLPELPVRSFDDFRSATGPLKWLAARAV